MDQLQNPVPEPPTGDDPHVSIVVARSGGIAGLRRVWTAEPPREEAPRWIALIDECPWDAASGADQRGADRFVWSVDARCADLERHAELGDDDLEGPWRQLVDLVREASRADEPPRTHRVSPRERRRPGR